MPCLFWAPGGLLWAGAQTLSAERTDRGGLWRRAGSGRRGWDPARHQWGHWTVEKKPDQGPGGWAKAWGQEKAGQAPKCREEREADGEAVGAGGERAGCSRVARDTCPLMLRVCRSDAADTRSWCCGGAQAAGEGCRLLGRWSAFLSGYHRLLKVERCPPIPPPSPPFKRAIQRLTSSKHAHRE